MKPHPLIMPSSLEPIEELSLEGFSLRGPNRRNTRDAGGNTISYYDWGVSRGGREFMYSLGECSFRLTSRGENDLSVLVFLDGEDAERKVEKFEKMRELACDELFNNHKKYLGLNDGIDSAKLMMQTGGVGKSFYRPKDKETGETLKDGTPMMYLKAFVRGFRPIRFQKLSIGEDDNPVFEDLDYSQLKDKKCKGLIYCSSGRITSHAKRSIKPVCTSVVVTEMDADEIDTTLDPNMMNYVSSLRRGDRKSPTVSKIDNKDEGDYREELLRDEGLDKMPLPEKPVAL